MEARGNVKALSIKQASTEDVGVYTVDATNEVGEATCSANLNVLGTHMNFKYREKHLGHQSKFHCELFVVE